MLEILLAGLAGAAILIAIRVTYRSPRPSEGHISKGDDS